jgi:hypothetical protein
MADRTLKRPMFRRGGVANEGIMTGLQNPSGSMNEPRGGLHSLVRPGYAEGDKVESWKDQQSWWKDALDVPPAAYGEMTPQMAEEYLYNYDSLGDALTSGTRELTGLTNDAIGNFITNPILKLGSWATGIGDPDKIKPYNTKQWNIDRWSGTKRDEAGNIIEEQGVTDVVRPGSDAQGTKPGDTVIDTTKEIVVGDNTRESDVKAIYEDILPLLQSTMGVDDSEMNRQKYLELAKFGANLMAQPGGSLTRAIGKAAEQPLEGLSRIAETKRKAKKVPAEIAMKIALSETESGTVGKQIRDLKRVYPQRQGETVTEWNKRIGDKVLESGTATKQATAEGRIQKDATVLGTLLDDEFAGTKAARAIDATGLDTSYFKMLPKKKENYQEGQHYIKKDGTLWLFDGKDMLEWKPKKQKFE